MVFISCPYCGGAYNVIRFGYNRSGTARCRCLDCKKCFTLSPKSRRLTSQKQAAIERALAERIAQSGIARILSVSRNTIRAVRQRGHSA
jgi:transposase-like protein